MLSVYTIIIPKPCTNSDLHPSKAKGIELHFHNVFFYKLPRENDSVPDLSEKQVWLFIELKCLAFAPEIAFSEPFHILMPSLLELLVTALHIPSQEIHPRPMRFKGNISLKNDISFIPSFNSKHFFLTNNNFNQFRMRLFLPFRVFSTF